MLWKGSERRIGKVRLVKEKRFGKIEMAAMIFIYWVLCGQRSSTSLRLTVPIGYLFRPNVHHLDPIWTQGFYLLPLKCSLKSRPKSS